MKPIKKLILVLILWALGMWLLLFLADVANGQTLYTHESGWKIKKAVPMTEYAEKVPWPGPENFRAFHAMDEVLSEWFALLIQVPDGVLLYFGRGAYFLLDGEPSTEWIVTKNNQSILFNTVPLLIDLSEGAFDTTKRGSLLLYIRVPSLPNRPALESVIPHGVTTRLEVLR